MSIDALKNNPKALSDLIDLGVDFFLDQPLKSVGDPKDWSQLVVTALRKAASHGENEAWLRENLEKAFAETKAKKIQGQLKDHVPPESVAAVGELASLPLNLNQGLVLEFFEHKLVRVILREVLTQSILSYTEQIVKMLPGGKVMSGFLGVAKDLASGFSQTNKDLEAKAKEAVEAALVPSIGIIAQIVASTEHNEDFASYRQHVVSCLFGLTLDDVADTLQQISPEDFATRAVTVVRTVIEWEQLESTVAEAMEAGLEQVGDQSVRNFISGTSLEEDWRSTISERLADLARPFFASEQFDKWAEAYRVN